MTPDRTPKKRTYTGKTGFTPNLRHRLQPLYEEYRRRCFAIGDTPETFESWAGSAEDWTKDRFKSDEWNNENIWDGIGARTLQSYVVPVEEERA